MLIPQELQLSQHIGLSRNGAQFENLGELVKNPIFGT